MLLIPAYFELRNTLGASPTQCKVVTAREIGLPAESQDSRPRGPHLPCPFRDGEPTPGRPAAEPISL